MDLSRPQSRGYVRLRSKNPSDAPLTVFNHYESHQDLTHMIDGIRLTRERLVRQPAWQQFHPRELSPGPGVVSDRDLEAFLRKATGTSYHPSGSCRMGTDADAVVDSEGRLNAVSGLRVADASIMPKVITGNLKGPVIMMAEKISDRILGRQPLPPSDAMYHRSPVT